MTDDESRRMLVSMYRYSRLRAICETIAAVVPYVLLYLLSREGADAIVRYSMAVVSVASTVGAWRAIRSWLRARAAVRWHL